MEYFQDETDEQPNEENIGIRQIQRLAVITTNSRLIFLSLDRRSSKACQVQLF